MEKKERIRRMAIVTEADCSDGVGKQIGDTVLSLRMVCVSGEERGKELVREYAFAGDPPDYLRRDLLRLGFLVNSVSEMLEIIPNLAGILVRVSLVQDGGTLRVFIDDYFGRDDPKKYAVNR